MTGSKPFSPLERRSVAERVRDDILGRINAGEISPGQRLPAERTLAEQFSVARTSVREAIQSLIAVGAVERSGNRCFVAERLPEVALPVSDHGRKSRRTLHEARRVLELTLFELSGFRATTQERRTAAALARLPLPSTPEEIRTADRRFHAAVAAGCGNPLLLELYGRVLDKVCEEPPDDSPGGDHAASTEAAIRAAHEHRIIADRFVDGDVEGMLSAVEEHLGRVEGRLGRITGPGGGRPPLSRASLRVIGL